MDFAKLTDLFRMAYLANRLWLSFHRYMVSPWQQNGNALAYVKRYDTSVDHRQLVRSLLALPQ